MAEIWYITNSNDDGKYLNNPEETTEIPSCYFEPYILSPSWSKFITTDEILIDYGINNYHNYVFMSNNPNQLEKFVHIWNSFNETN
jgi:hypothetical protein